MSNNKNISIIPELLGVIFVGLKLTGVIDWSWWYVTMPFWAGFALLVILMLLALLLKAIKKENDNGIN